MNPSYGSPNPVSYHHELARRDPLQLDLVVIHCTELPDLDTARAYAERVVHPSGTGNCGHLYIDRSGHREQYVAIDRVAHHVRDNNERSIGIELVNLGRYPDWFHSGHQHLTDAYPSEQIASLIEVLKRLGADLPGLRLIAGHEDLDRELIPAEDDPSIRIRRKIDPGPLFPWKTVLDRLPLERLMVRDLAGRN